MGLLLVGSMPPIVADSAGSRMTLCQTENEMRRSRAVWERGRMVDRQFAEAKLAEVYDALYTWDDRDDFPFYLPLAMSAATVLDVGCGTGAFLHRVRDQGHAGRLTGLDPGRGMLDRARRRTGIEWVFGDLTTTAWRGAFELIVMTGHAFQVFVTDEELRAALAAIRRALTPEGRFAFETRNPSARAWESWTPENAVETVTPAGERVRMASQVEPPDHATGLVSFTTTYTSPSWDAPELSHSTLRFLDADALASFLAEAGLVIHERYGDFGRGPLTDASPEIVVVAGVDGAAGAA
jgi:SAM-dependent methyltransferase